MPALFDPWETVTDDARLSVTTARLPDGMAGVTDGAGRIWLDDRLTATEALRPHARARAHRGRPPRPPA
ncbi:MAG: hypothetical protein LBE67_12170 [Kocuria palustris]|nr:hypothetical protein [Kocuria palustris]